jgi:ABC-type uncharacterized transport system permease subunit
VTVTPEPDEQSGFAALSSFYDRAGGLITPIAATVLAFFVGGLVVLATGANPLAAYKAIFNGTGLVWFFQIPWDPHSSEFADLQQTLLITTPLILTALAVAFAFRCGMFNIGGQGQYWVGLICALYVGLHFEGLGRHRGHPQGDRWRPRGDLDDHAQLDCDLDGALAGRARRTAAGK